MIERFLRQTHFESVEDYNQHLEFINLRFGVLKEELLIIHQVDMVDIQLVI